MGMGKIAAMPVSKATNAYDLLQEIKQIILDEPLRCDQRCWRNRNALSKPACGTVGCIAGWINALKGSAWTDTPGHDAAEILGLNWNDAERLFRGSAASYNGTGYCIESQTQAHAEAGARHIDRFCADYEAQLKAKAV